MRNRAQFVGITDEGLTYDLEDVSMLQGFAGSTVVELKTVANGTTARVEIRLSDKRVLLLISEDDETNITV